MRSAAVISRVPPSGGRRIRAGVVGTALLAGVFGVIALFAATRISDPDTMQYLAGGRYIVSHGLEHGCVFSYSSEDCQIVYPQWLFQVLSFGVYAAAGFAGLGCLQVALVITLFATILVDHRRNGWHPFVTAYLFLLVVLVARERFQFRADLFALLPAVLLYYALDRLRRPGRDAGSRRALIGIGAIQAVWANIHGSFPIGFLLCGAFLAEAAVEYLSARGARRAARGEAAGRLRGTLAATAVVAAASFANPYGPKAFFQPIRFMLQGTAMAPQLEFLSPFAPADLHRTPVLAFQALLAVVAAAYLLSYRSIRARDLLILAPLAYLAVRGVRHIALFSVFCAVLAPRPIEALRLRAAAWLERRTSAGARAALAGVAAAVLAFASAGIGYASATDALYRYDSNTRRTGFGLTDLVFPTAAADFVEQAGLRGNMFNDYSVGTYLNWRLFPARKTFIDGHTYTAEKLAYYFKIMTGAIPYPSVVSRYDVKFFFLSHKAAESRLLIGKLLRDPQWALVYFDEFAMIFVARGPENQSVIDRYRIDPATLAAAPPREPRNIVHPKDLYLGHTDQGLILSSLGLGPAAVRELEAAARLNPRSFVTLTALGNQRAIGGDPAGAIEACAAAVELRGGYSPSRSCLGVTLLNQKRAPEAIPQLEEALRITPDRPMAHFYLGAAYEAVGDRERAVEQYRREVAVNPSLKLAHDALRRLKAA